MDLVPRDLLLLLIGLEFDAVLPVQLVKVHFCLVIVHNLLLVLIVFAAVFVVGVAVMLLVIVIVGGA